jgi:hypothetical protein
MKSPWQCESSGAFLHSGLKERSPHRATYKKNTAFANNPVRTRLNSGLPLGVADRRLAGWLRAADGL